MSKRILVLSFCIAGMASALFAEAPGIPFLNMPIGAHAQSMGGAYSAKVEDASAIYWNPASLVKLKNKELFFYNTKFISDFQYNYLAYAHPFKTSALAVSFGHFFKGEFDGRDRSGKPTGGFSASDMALDIAGAKKISRRTSLGLGVKWVRSSIQSFSADGFAMDLSATVQLSKKANLVGGFYHLGPPMRFLDEPMKLPSVFSMGFSRNFSILTLTADSRFSLYDQDLSFSFGVEFTPLQIISFRFGFFPDVSPVPSGPSSSSLDRFAGMGVGFGLKLFSRSKFDYAFVPMGELGSTHHFDLSWKF